MTKYLLSLFGILFLATFIYSCEEVIEPSPEANFVWKPTAADPQAIKFTNISENASTYAWDFGDDKGVSVEANPTYTYEKGGEYIVTLVATSSSGKTAAKNETINVEARDNSSLKVEASFSWKASYSNPLEINFSNSSKNAVSYAWDFGDGKGTSTDKDPTYTYANEGTYSIKLTAMGQDGSRNESSTDIKVLSPPVATNSLLWGTTSKKWKLARISSALSVGTADFSTVYWSNPTDLIGQRTCLFDNEYVFKKDGGFEFKSNGSVWLESGTKTTGVEECVNESELSSIIKAGDGTPIDISAWASSTSHTFAYDDTKKELTLNGRGSYLGLPKASGDGTRESFPQPFANSTTYKVVTLSDGGNLPDTMMVQYNYGSEAWRIILVSYKSDGQEPSLPTPPQPPPVAKFKYEIDASNSLKVKFTDLSTSATSYSWDFGDSKGTSTDRNPVYTYGGAGTYDVVLTVKDKDRKSSASTQSITLKKTDNSSLLTGAVSKTWRLAQIGGALVVGPSDLSTIWWENKASDITTRSCLFNHEYIFNANGKMEFKAKDSFWYESGIKGSEQCGKESDLATTKKSSSGTDIDISSWASGTYDFTFDENNKKLTLKGKGAFLGLPKISGDGSKESNPQPYASETTYEVVKLASGGNTPDTLIVEYKFSSPAGVWRVILVSGDGIGSVDPPPPPTPPTVTIPTTGYTTPTTYSGMKRIWDDEFSGSSIDETKWNFEIGTGSGGWGNNELQYYRKENASIKDGHLVISAKQEDFGGQNYTSTRMISENKFDFTYGRVDIRAALPFGQGIWPALWMLGANFRTVGWPSCGEIDIMEFIGKNPQDIHGTLHWSNSSGGHTCTCDSGKKFTKSGDKVFTNSFHVFSIVWDASEIIWYVDDNEYYRTSITGSDMTEFHNDFFLLMNVAVGGNWPGNPDATSTYPQFMIVDYVRVFQKN